MKIKTIEAALKILAEKTAKARAELASAAEYSEDDIKKARSLVDSGEYENVNFEALSFFNLKSNLEGLLGTAKQSLMVVATDYIMVPAGSKLVSPAGFHPSERVFVAIEGAVMTNRLPKSSNLGYFDLRNK